MKRIRKETENISFLLPVREFPDKGTKWLLEFGENVEGLLKIVANDLVERLDFSRLEQVNQTVTVRLSLADITTN